MEEDGDRGGSSGGGGGTWGNLDSGGDVEGFEVDLVFFSAFIVGTVADVFFFPYDFYEI